MFNIDYIIPLCNSINKDFECRVKNLMFIIDHLLSCKDIKINVHIIEQITNNNFCTYKEKLNEKKINYINVFYPVFNKSWLCNIGVKNSISNNIFIAEADVIYDDIKNYVFLLNDINSKSIKWCFCWDNILFLGPDGTKRVFNDLLFDSDNIRRRSYPRPGSTEGGILYFNKDFYLNELYGMSEYFENLGGMDNDTAFRARKITGTYIKQPYTLYHLYHPIVSVSKEHSNNLSILHKTKNKYDKVMSFYKNLEIGRLDKPLISYVKFKNM